MMRFWKVFSFRNLVNLWSVVNKFPEYNFNQKNKFPHAEGNATDH